MRTSILKSQIYNHGVNMAPFNMGKKIFFLFPPTDFTQNIIKPLFREGFEVYTIHNFNVFSSLFSIYPDSILFINSDYPFMGFNLDDFNDVFLKQDKFSDLTVYTIYKDSLTFGDRFADFINIDEDSQSLFIKIKDLLNSVGAHGKRDSVRFGTFPNIISSFSFKCSGLSQVGDLYDISPQGLSFSSDINLNHLIGEPFEKMALSVGAFEILVDGVLSSSRQMQGKTIYVATFKEDEKTRDDLLNFVYTSLEKNMDDLIKKINYELEKKRDK